MSDAEVWAWAPATEVSGPVVSTLGYEAVGLDDGLGAIVGVSPRTDGGYLVVDSTTWHDDARVLVPAGAVRAIDHDAERVESGCGAGISRTRRPSATTATARRTGASRPRISRTASHGGPRTGDRGRAVRSAPCCSWSSSGSRTATRGRSTGTCGTRAAACRTGWSTSAAGWSRRSTAASSSWRARTPGCLQEWVLHWQGLADFEIVPVVPGAETREVVEARL